MIDIDIIGNMINFCAVCVMIDLEFKDFFKWFAICLSIATFVLILFIPKIDTIHEYKELYLLAESKVENEVYKVIFQGKETDKIPSVLADNKSNNFSFDYEQNANKYEIDIADELKVIYFIQK